MQVVHHSLDQIDEFIQRDGGSVARIVRSYVLNAAITDGGPLKVIAISLRAASHSLEGGTERNPTTRRIQSVLTVRRNWRRCHQIEA